MILQSALPWGRERRILGERHQPGELYNLVNWGVLNLPEFWATWEWFAAKLGVSVRTVQRWWRDNSHKWNFQRVRRGARRWLFQRVPIKVSPQEAQTVTPLRVKNIELPPIPKTEISPTLCTVLVEETESRSQSFELLKPPASNDRLPRPEPVGGKGSDGSTVYARAATRKGVEATNRSTVAASVGASAPLAKEQPESYSAPPAKPNPPSADMRPQGKRSGQGEPVEARHHAGVVSVAVNPPDSSPGPFSGAGSTPARQHHKPLESAKCETKVTQWNQERKPVSNEIAVRRPENRHFENFLAVFRGFRKPLNNSDVLKAEMRWGWLNPNDVTACAIVQAAVETCSQASSVRFIPLPVNFLLAEPWTRTVLPGEPIRHMDWMEQVAAGLITTSEDQLSLPEQLARMAAKGRAA